MGDDCVLLLKKESQETSGDWKVAERHGYYTALKKKNGLRLLKLKLDDTLL